MNIDVGDPEWVALWGVALAAAFFVCMPMVLGLLGLTRVGKTFADGAEYPIPPEGEAEYGMLVGQLRALGFEPLGVKRTVVHFFCHHWAKHFTTHVFGSRRQRCFAAVYQLAPGDPMRISLVTVFADGSMVTTGNSLKSLRIEELDYVRRGLPTSDMSELLHGHLSVVGSLGPRARGEPSLDPHFYAERDGYHEQRYLLRQSGQLSRQPLQMALTFMSILAFPAAVQMGVDHWLTPVAILTGAVLFAALMPLLRRAASRELSTKDREGGDRWDDNSPDRPAGGQSDREAIIQREQRLFDRKA
jgi:hypothetical protein